jgi:hypothetical protein
MTIRSFLLSLSISSAAFAQVGGPILGYVPEGAAIRSLYGLPAAGAIGGLIDAGRDFAQIAISPQQNFAIAADSSGEVLLVTPGTKSGAGLTAISGAGANPNVIAISPGGGSAALWFSSVQHIQVVTGLPDSPSVRTIDASFLNASPSAIAVSDDGQWAVGLWAAGNQQAGVYAFGPTAQVIPLQTDPGVVALAFFHNSHNLALATSARATSIADVGGANQPSVLYDYSSQSLTPRAIALSFDNQRAVIADSTGKLVNINLANASANIVDCACSPSGVYGLGGSIFRLNGTGGPARNALESSGPTPELKLFDAAAGAVWIVPPALSESTLAGKAGRQ